MSEQWYAQAIHPAMADIGALASYLLHILIECLRQSTGCTCWASTTGMPSCQYTLQHIAVTYTFSMQHSIVIHWHSHLLIHCRSFKRDSQMATVAQNHFFFMSFRLILEQSDDPGNRTSDFTHQLPVEVVAYVIIVLAGAENSAG